MKEWKIQSEDPGLFIISADPRCSATNYINDHIWEIYLGGGEPSALSIQTTFGYRARNFRIFFRITEGDNTLLDPSKFKKSPSITKFYPNYLRLEYTPFTGIDVINEYWVPDSNSLAGRIQVTNSRLGHRQIRFQLVALLYPIKSGQRMATSEVNSTALLSGETGNLFPVTIMNGSVDPTIGPYPSLSVVLDLTAGGSRQIIWAHAALDNFDNSLKKARSILLKDWDSEMIKLSVLDQSMIQIDTGDPEWNAAFALGLKYAYNLLIGPTKNLPAVSYVASRLPDQGCSPKGDGTDFDHLWDGQLPLEVYFLSTFLLPSSPELATGLLENFIETQTQGGFIDLKPGLSGQRKRVLATPILAQLAWDIFNITEDRIFLENIFPKLLSFIQSWFSNQQDRDEDGLPEWTNSLQSGIEEHPVFSQWQSWTQGGDISKVESPSLCAFLYNEIQILIKIAKITRQSSPIPPLEALADNLKKAVETSWSNENSIFLNWDRESHYSPRGVFLGTRNGSGTIQINQKFDYPVRIAIRVATAKELPHNINIFIHGINSSGNYRIEKLDTSKVRWQIDQGNVSCDQIYSVLDYIDISGVNPEDIISVKIIDLTIVDLSLTLPLWAGMLNPHRASQLIEKTILNEQKFWRPNGIPTYLPQQLNADYPWYAVNILLNNLIGEGLINYGYQDEVATLVSKLMKVVIDNLKLNKSFYRFYNSENGSGIGDRNNICGLPPMSLFLKTLGVQIVSPTKIQLEGRNPFPWPVTIRYRGCTIYREKNKTSITFPGGQSAIVKNPEKREITLENINEN